MLAIVPLPVLLHLTAALSALALGIVQTTVPADDLDTALADLVASLLKVDAGAAIATKRLLQQAPDNTLDEQRAVERREQSGRILGR